MSFQWEDYMHLAVSLVGEEPSRWKHERLDRSGE